MLNIAFVTTWGSKCGISTYSEELCEWLSEKGVRVQALAPQEEGSCFYPPQNIPFRTVWNRGDENMFLGILGATEGCDVVHFQHEYGLFQSHQGFIDTLRHLRKRKTKTVVTLHTIFPYGLWNSGVIDSIRANADVLITHTVEAYAAVSLAHGSGKVIRVNHGTRVNAPKGNREAGLGFIGVPKQYWGASFGGAIGFMSDGKNLDQTIMAFAEGINRGWIDAKKVGLIICGDAEDEAFLHLRLEAARRDCGYTQNIFIINKFIPRDKMKNVMAIMDWAVLNTKSNTLSASGQVHAHIAYGIPMVVADRPIYRDGVTAGALPFQLKQPGELYTLSTVNAISTVANNQRIREEMKRMMLRYGDETGWDRIADQHIGIYKEICG